MGTAIRAIFVLCLFTYSTVATPIDKVSELRAARAVYDELYQLYPRQEQQALPQPVTFQTVTTSQTQAGTITTTCNVTLSPITAADGSTQIQQEKQCKFDISAAVDNSSSSSSSSSNGAQTSTTSAATETTATGTSTQSQETQTTQTQSSSESSSSASSSSVTNTAVPAISEIGTGVIPASSTGTVSSPSSVQTSASATTSVSAPPAVSVIGPGQIPVTATGTVTDASASASVPASATSLVTSVVTLSDGQVSTSISTPSAAAAEQVAATTPGQKLEVLPIGLGVFAGVSVIALIVVGLVTYERTKYRKAFRQRKLAEAGANMGYGGMAERT